MSEQQQHHSDLQLSADDSRLLDALVEAGFERDALGALPSTDERRVRAINGMLELMNDYPVEDADESLLHATLARINRHEDDRSERMNLEAVRGRERGGRRIRLPDFITVAAVLLIAVSVMWPTFNFMRQRSMDTACANNMRQLGVAFGQYAYDNNGNLPLAMAGPFAGWDSIHNVLNLEPLVGGSYCQAHHLNCPGHHEEAGPSYSYRWFMSGQQALWGGARTTLTLGDLNPIVAAARSGRYVPPLSTSINHAGRGQNVLVSDGGTLWLEEPVFGRGDNIWLPGAADRLQPGAQPSDPLDVFLAQ